MYICASSLHLHPSVITGFVHLYSTVHLYSGQGDRGARRQGAARGGGREVGDSHPGLGGADRQAFRGHRHPDQQRQCHQPHGDPGRDECFVNIMEEK